jgi:cation diffusion facilitator family transporter
MKNLGAIRRVLYITMALNLVAMAAKLMVGYWTGSLSLIADGFDSLFDSASNVIGLVGIYIASRPADEEHPYGHRKFETLSAIAISLLLFVTTWELVESALERLRSPEMIDPTVNLWSFGSLLVSIAVHITVVVYELNAGRRLKSDVLVADAMHTRADIYISLSVVGGLVAVRLGYPVVDPLLALVIAVLIAKIGIDIIRESSKTLLDGAAVPISEIERIVMGVHDVLACHDVRSRGHEDAIYVDLHIKVAPQMTTAQSHAVAHDVQHRLRSEIPAIQDVVVHVEPEDREIPDGSALIPALRSVAERLGIAIHNITARQVDGKYHVEAHILVDGSLPLMQAHQIASQLEEMARSQIENLAEIVTHIEPQSGESGQPYETATSADEIAERVQSLLSGWDAGMDCHNVRVYAVGDSWAASVHCLLDGRMPTQEAHIIAGEMEGRLRDAIPRLERVAVHAEPLVANEDGAR